MDSSIPVKAYLGAQEIRRFTVDASACRSIDYMRQRLHHLFSVPQEEPLTIAWRDDEGDLVTISSGEELLDAVGRRSDATLRLYLSRRGEEAARRPPHPPPTPPSPHLPYAPWAWSHSGAFAGGRPWGGPKWMRKGWRAHRRHHHGHWPGYGGRADGGDHQQRLLHIGALLNGVLTPLGIDVTLVPTHGPAAAEEAPQPSGDRPAAMECPGDAAPSPSPQVAHALDQMVRMGYTDDAGRLTRLLTATDGDIGRALDAIKANALGRPAP